MNKTGIKPVGRAILLKPYQPERSSSVIVLPPSVAQNDMVLEARAIVVDIGPHAWHDEKGPRCSIGDHVMVSQMSGKIVQSPVDDQWYRIINDRDVYATIQEKQA